MHINEAKPDRTIWGKWTLDPVPYKIGMLI